MANTNFYFVNTEFNFYTADYVWSPPAFSYKGGWDWTPTDDGTNQVGPIFGNFGLLSATKAVGSWINHQNDLAQSDPPPAVFPGRKIALARFATNPLTAQAISGQVDLRIGAYNWYGDSALGPRDAGPGGPYLYTRVYLWISVGETDSVRSVLLDYTEGPGSGVYWPIQDQDPDGPYRIIGLGAPQTVNGTILLGDRVVLEFGNVMVALTDQADIGGLFIGTFDNYGNTGPTFSASPDAVLGETGFEYVNDPLGTYKVDNRAGFISLPLGGDPVIEPPNTAGCPVDPLP